MASRLADNAACGLHRVFIVVFIVVAEPVQACAVPAGRAARSAERD